MEDLIYTMVLSDGTIIENLRKNGDNYISASKLTADMFEGKLSEVTVKTSENEMVMENMDLVQITEMDGEYWFVSVSYTHLNPVLYITEPTYPPSVVLVAFI